MIVANRVAPKRYPNSSPRPKQQPRSSIIPKIKLLCVIVLIVIALTAFLLSYRFIQIHRAKREIVRLETELGRAQERYNAISLAVAKMKNPERIMSLAQQERGLVMPQKDQFVTVKTKQ